MVEKYRPANVLALQSIDSEHYFRSVRHFDMTIERLLRVMRLRLNIFLEDSLGHSSLEFAIKLAQLADVRHVVLTHHDPMRTDQALDADGNMSSGHVNRANRPNIWLLPTYTATSSFFLPTRSPSKYGPEPASGPSRGIVSFCPAAVDEVSSHALVSGSDNSSVRVLPEGEEWPVKQVKGMLGER